MLKMILTDKRLQNLVMLVFLSYLTPYGLFSWLIFLYSRRPAVDFNLLLDEWIDYESYMPRWEKFASLVAFGYLYWTLLKLIIK